MLVDFVLFVLILNDFKCLILWLLWNISVLQLIDIKIVLRKNIKKVHTRHVIDNTRCVNVNILFVKINIRRVIVDIQSVNIHIRCVIINISIVNINSRYVKVNIRNVIVSFQCVMVNIAKVIIYIIIFIGDITTFIVERRNFVI